MVIMIIKDITVKNKDGKEIELEIYMNTKSVMAIERDLKMLSPKYNYYKCLPMLDEGEMTILLIYLCNSLHKRGEKRPVGIDFFDDNDINIFAYTDELIVKLAECLTDNQGKVKQEVGK
jgi:hypothetical protein